MLRSSGSRSLMLWQQSKMCVLYGCLDNGRVIKVCITEAQDVCIVRLFILKVCHPGLYY